MRESEREPGAGRTATTRRTPTRRVEERRGGRSRYAPASVRLQRPAPCTLLQPSATPAASPHAACSAVPRHLAALWPPPFPSLALRWGARICFAPMRPRLAGSALSFPERPHPPLVRRCCSLRSRCPGVAALGFVAANDAVLRRPRFGHCLGPLSRGSRFLAGVLSPCGC